MVHIDADKLQDIVCRIFASTGARQETARQVAWSLVENNLVGHDSHGVLRVGSYVDMVLNGRTIPDAPMTTLKETASTAVLDGGRNFGQIICRDAMNMAIDKARQHDTGLIAIRNCGHTGRMGEYVVQAARQGFIGLVLGAGPRQGGTVAPYLGTSPMFNTNPMSMGVPTQRHEPVFFDFATSAGAWGKIEVALDKGELLPEGYILDKDGNPSRDPHDAREGVLLTFGKAKGYCLAFFVELLTGTLTGISCAPLDGYAREWGVVLGAVNISAFQPLDQFRDRVDRLVDAVKTARKAPGVEEILVPGEIEWNTRTVRSRDGLDLPDATWERIIGAGAKVGVEVSL